MAPKKAPHAPVRRSGRIASRTGSRASSVAPEEDTSSALGKVSKSRVSKKKTTTTAPPKTSTRFSVALAIDRILSGHREFIATLTLPQANAVIEGMADRIHDLEEKNATLTVERDVAVSAYEEKRALRDSFFRMRFQQKRLSDAADTTADTTSDPPISSTPVAEHSSTPAQSAQTPFHNTEMTSTAEDSNSTNFDLTDTSLLTGTPAPAPAVRTSLFGSILKTISSPFTKRKSAPETPTQQPAVTKKLGELPASRKRAAPEPRPQPEPQPEPQPRSQLRTAAPPAAVSQHHNTTNMPALHEPATERAHRVLTGPSSRNPLAETSLDTITEQSEHSTTIAPMPTPSRAPRSVTQMRRKRNLSTSVSSTPSRAWNRPRAPREPNADNRLVKLRTYYTLKGEIRAMDEDEDIKEMTAERPMKRVKVDELVSIPHNRPGDAEGTFRMPDIDSDDEMEVDEDEEMRANVFAVSEAEKEAEAPKAQPQQQERVALPEKPLWQFPNVGELPSGEVEENLWAGAKFAVGLAHYSLTGSLLPLF